MSFKLENSYLAVYAIITPQAKLVDTYLTFFITHIKKPIIEIMLLSLKCRFLCFYLLQFSPKMTILQCNENTQYDNLMELKLHYVMLELQFQCSIMEFYFQNSVIKL